MIQVFTSVNFDWLAWRKIFIGVSVLLMFAGLGSALFRQWKHPNGTEAFNLGVDFKGGTVVTARFKQPPTAEAIREVLAKQSANDAIIQPVTDKPDTFLIKLPLKGTGDGESQAEVEAGARRVRQALNALGPEGDAYQVIGTDFVGAVAGAQLRNKAVAVTLAALVGILVYIAFRFQWEVSLTVIAAMLTLVGFSVNDTIVVFDRIRENRRLHRRDSLYKITNDSINQTLSRTVITNGLVFLSVFSMVLFGGEVLRGFSLALLIGVTF